jgi:ubiquinone biosynthesis protein
VGVVLTVLVYAFAVRRLLGLRLSPLRALLGGLVALVVASPIVTAIGSSLVKHNGSWSFVPAVWFVILGVAIALLIGMLVLVIAEVLVPSGTMPGPRYVIRGLRKRTRRVRRYSQISRILSATECFPTCEAHAAQSCRPTTAGLSSLARCASRLRTAMSRSSSSASSWPRGATFCPVSSPTN